MKIQRSRRSIRSGAIAVEVAILLPLIMFLAVIGVDYARIFSRIMIMETASRNGCVWASQEPLKANNKAAIAAVALKDLTDISPTPTVDSQVYTAADGFQYVQVDVSMTFTTITKFPGVPSQTNLKRTTHMRVCPTTPKPGTY